MNKWQVDIAAITEINDKKRDDNEDGEEGNKFVIQGYTYIENVKGRGVGLFIKEHLKLIRYPELEKIF